MKQERNRVTEGMQEWKAKEQEIISLFSADAAQTRHVLQLKLDHMYELARSIKNPSKEEEKMLRVLSGEIDRLEKRLWPNLIVRMFVQLGRAIDNLFRVSPDFEERMKTIGKPVSIVPVHPAKEVSNEIKIEQPVKVHKMVEQQQLGEEKGLGLKR